MLDLPTPSEWMAFGTVVTALATLLGGAAIIYAARVGKASIRDLRANRVVQREFEIAETVLIKVWHIDTKAQIALRTLRGFIKMNQKSAKRNEMAKAMSAMRDTVTANFNTLADELSETTETLNDDLANLATYFGKNATDAILDFQWEAFAVRAQGAFLANQPIWEFDDEFLASLHAELDDLESDLQRRRDALQDILGPSVKAR